MTLSRFYSRGVLLGMLLMAAVASLAACTGQLPPPTPVALADTTTIDERAALTVEIAYKATGALVEAAVDAGRIKGATALRVDAIDAEAARWVGAARSAYDAGNAAGYAEAAAKAGPLIAQLRSLVLGGK